MKAVRLCFLTHFNNEILQRLSIICIFFSFFSLSINEENPVWVLYFYIDCTPARERYQYGHFLISKIAGFIPSYAYAFAFYLQLANCPLRMNEIDRVLLAEPDTVISDRGFSEYSGDNQDQRRHCHPRFRHSRHIF